MPENLQEKWLTDCVSYGLDITWLKLYLRNPIPESDCIVAFVAFRFSSSFVKFNDRINKVPMDDSYNFLTK